jgi:hypothetical protein
MFWHFSRRAKTLFVSATGGPEDPAGDQRQGAAGSDETEERGNDEDKEIGSGANTLGKA